MKVNHERQTGYAFSDISVDAAQLMVYRDGRELSLPPKAVETLLALISRRGQIVSKDELMEMIWTDAVVEESNLSRYVHLLRSQLGKPQGGGEYIETFRRRGYRFTGEVEVLKLEKRDPGSVPQAPAARDEVTAPSHEKALAAKVVRIEDWSHSHDQLPGRAELDPEPAPKGGSGRLTRRRILFAAIGVVSIASIAAVSAFLLSRLSPPVLTDQDTIIVADFENRTGDPVFDGTLRQGLIIQLQQSPFLSILPSEQVRETLRLMKRPPGTFIDREVAKEICIRRGFKAFVAGSVVKLGEVYVIELEAVSAGTGQPVAIEQVQASGKESVLESLSAAARGLRAQLGEQLSSIEKLDVPLEVTTGSLEALRMHTLAWKEMASGKAESAIPYFLRAIELDPEFASAYGDLAVAYDNSGHRLEAVKTVKDAFGRSDKVSEIERLNIADLYHSLVTYRVDERKKILEIYKNLYPRDFRPRLRLASVHLFFGNYEQAIEEARESVRLGSGKSHFEWGRSLIALGRYAEARDVLQKGEESGFDSQAFHFQLAELGILTGDPGLTERELAVLDQPRFRPSGVLFRARKNFQEGKFAEGLDLYREAIAFAGAKGEEQRVIRLMMEAAIHASFFGKCEVAMEFLRDRTNLLLVEGAQALAAEALARCGKNSEAEALLDELLALYPKGTVPNKLTAKIVRALISERRGDAQTTAAVLGEVPDGLEDKSGFRVRYLKGKAFLRLGKSTEAAREFRRIIDNRGKDPLSPLYWLSVLGMARSQAAAGDGQGAKESYEKFLAAWSEADGDLPELKAARTEYGALRK